MEKPSLLELWNEQKTEANALHLPVFFVKLPPDSCRDPFPSHRRWRGKQSSPRSGELAVGSGSRQWGSVLSRSRFKVIRFNDLKEIGAPTDFLCKASLRPSLSRRRKSNPGPALQIPNSKCNNTHSKWPSISLPKIPYIYSKSTNPGTRVPEFLFRRNSFQAEAGFS